MPRPRGARSVLRGRRRDTGGLSSSGPCDMRIGGREVEGVHRAAGARRTSRRGPRHPFGSPRRRSAVDEHAVLRPIDVDRPTVRRGSRRRRRTGARVTRERLRRRSPPRRAPAAGAPCRQRRSARVRRRRSCAPPRCGRRPVGRTSGCRAPRAVRPCRHPPARPGDARGRRTGARARGSSGRSSRPRTARSSSSIHIGCRGELPSPAIVAHSTTIPSSSLPTRTSARSHGMSG